MEESISLDKSTPRKRIIKEYYFLKKNSMPINKMDEFLESHTANSLKRKQITSPTPT